MSERSRPPNDDWGATLDVPDPPWRSGSGKSTRAQLTRDAIVDAALKILDKSGADALNLSMRYLAAELGVGAASLYWHVASKSELIDLMIDRIAGQQTLPAPDPARWQEQLREAAFQMRRRLAQHRDLARLSMGRVPFGPNVVRWLEWSLALLRGAGMRADIAAYVGDLLSLYVGAYVMEEGAGLASPTGEDLPFEKIVGMFTEYLRGLPPDRFPNIHASLPFIFSDNDRFDLGLEIILRGLSTYIEPQPDKGAAPQV